MKIKQLVVGITATAILIPTLAACGNSSSASSDKSIELMTTWTGDRLTTLNKILKQYTKKSGVNVQVVSPGDQYETVMKTRMASRDMPDVFETHGWSLSRYKEYLTPLNDQSWAKNVDEAIKPVITDTNKKMYVEPVTMAINTIVYNKDAFAKAGVEVKDIRTWDDFSAACEQLKKTGITPIFIGNKDGETAQLAESIPPTQLTNDSVKDNQATALKNGTFNFEKYWTPISKMISTWNDKGYFNVDLLTSDNDAGVKQLAQGKSAMMFGGSNNITQALSYNPKANLGILSSPAAEKNGKNSLSMGEGVCFGVWKDSDVADKAENLLKYLSTKEVAGKIATASGDIPALTNVSNPDDYMSKALDETKATFADNLEYIPLFDREYLPNGMWDDLTNSFTDIFTTRGEQGIQQSVAAIKSAYTQKLAK
ncbi:MAG: extracellular solute-binding protein [Bifidobacteriaceae bacterium]|jgi:raffinose/stachyose/melibiose transport system substrate-binding protein|nr:extracellular solute-binding protein [Bifidobacteriaceae bacterium]MCI1978642.1 extracellular solute-binding protein [Bifidobacteriaceae bacterium]